MRRAQMASREVGSEWMWRRAIGLPHEPEQIALSAAHFVRSSRQRDGISSGLPDDESVEGEACCRLDLIHELVKRRSGRLLVRGISAFESGAGMAGVEAHAKTPACAADTVASKVIMRWLPGDTAMMGTRPYRIGR
jgi:hypothetical protein